MYKQNKLFIQCMPAHGTIIIGFHYVSYHLVYDAQAYIQHSVLVEQFQFYACHIVF